MVYPRHLPRGEVGEKCGKVLCLCEEANDVDEVVVGEVEPPDREAGDPAYAQPRNVAQLTDLCCSATAYRSRRISSRKYSLVLPYSPDCTRSSM